MNLNKRTKILAGVLVVIVAVLVLALAAGGSDDYDYGAQAKQEIDKYGYDAQDIEFEVEKGTNVFGVSLIKLTGTFSSGGEAHSFTMTTYADHELSTLDIDGRSFWGDDMGDAVYNFTVEEIGAFTHDDYGFQDTESPAEGMTFALVTVTVRNVGHADGLTLTSPEFENSRGDLYSYDWSATTHHDDTWSNLSLMSLGLGNIATYNLVFEVPEGTVDGGRVAWSDLDLDVYGYVFDPTLEPA